MILLLLFMVILTTINEDTISASGLCTENCSNIQPRVSIERSKHAKTQVHIDYHIYEYFTEEALWGNPCNYPEGEKPRKENEANIKSSEYAFNALKEICLVQEDLEKFANRFVKALYGVDNFDELLPKYENQKYLQGMPWYTHEVLPVNKHLFLPAPKLYMDGLMCRLDKFLPKIHKGCKMILASLRIVAYHGVCFDAIQKDNQLRPDLDRITRKIRKALCRFNDYMDKRGLTRIPMYRLELPNLDEDGNKTFVIFRDTINFIQYLGNVFASIVTKGKENSKP